VAVNEYQTDWLVPAGAQSVNSPASSVPQVLPETAAPLTVRLIAPEQLLLDETVQPAAIRHASGTKKNAKTRKYRCVPFKLLTF
jgi:hypothetical protein